MRRCLCACLLIFTLSVTAEVGVHYSGGRRPGRIESYLVVIIGTYWWSSFHSKPWSLNILDSMPFEAFLCEEYTLLPLAWVLCGNCSFEPQFKDMQTGLPLKCPCMWIDCVCLHFSSAVSFRPVQSASWLLSWLMSGKISPTPTPISSPNNHTYNHIYSTEEHIKKGLTEIIEYFKKASFSFMNPLFYDSLLY